MGEGNNKHAFAPMRGTKGGCGKHFPFRIIPDLGQILQDDLNSPGEQAPDVFDDDVPGTYFSDESCVFEPQAAARALLDSRMFPSLGYVLTGEAAAEHIHGRQFRAFQSIHILIKRNVRPVTCEYRPTKWINLAKPLMPESRPAQAKVTQTGSAEQAAHFQHDKAPVDALDVPNWGAWPAE